MVGPRKRRRALAAALGVLGVLGLLGATVVTGQGLPVAAAAAVHADDGAPAARAPDTSPLRVTIDAMAPAYLPAAGSIVVQGTVTNRAKEVWSNVQLYAFVGARLPAMRNAAQLAKASLEPFDAVVGDRLSNLPHPTVDTLQPGESARFSLEVPVSAIDLTRAGVYWFGVHALGESATTPSDNSADGRARTFLPFVPRRLTGSVPTALVLPVTRGVGYADDGTVSDVTSWTHSLSQGRVHDVVTFGDGAGTTPLTWLVDPAVVDAAGALSRGNPARSLDPPATTTATDPSSGPSASPSPTTPSASTDPAARTTTGTADPATGAAAGWLAAFSRATTGDQVLALPYGNLDVAGALHHDPDLVALAAGQRGSELDTLGITTTPALASPGGYLDAATIAAAGTDTTVLATDQMFPRPPPALADVDGQTVVVTSTGAASGGPGPGPAVTAIDLRQRILAEAAVRLLKKDVRPLVVVLPTEHGLSDPGAFFSGLQADWLDLETVAQLQDSAVSPTPVAPADLVYPPLQRRRELDADTFGAAAGLIASGTTLQGVLTTRTDLAATVTREALTGVSYATRTSPAAARARTDLASGWIASRLGSIGISAPRGVTLSSAAGKFAATLTNRLNESVTVRVVARSDAGLVIAPSRTVELAPHAHSTVILQAQASTNKVHNVTLMVTDSAGTPLGATDELPIRSAQVSGVIWIIMGTGGVILFGAIGLRLLRRIRGTRRPTAAG